MFNSVLQNKHLFRNLSLTETPFFLFSVLMLSTFMGYKKMVFYIMGGKYETESSGGITFDTLRDYAECGVDFISVGALTHSVKGLDMSFKAC